MQFIFYFIVISIVPLLIHFRLKRTYAKYSEKPVSSELSGYEVARKILDANGLYNVEVEEVEGHLSDHYDPTTKIVRLSSSNFYGRSISGASVAAHEVGHAVQDKENFSFLRLRHKLVPVANIGSSASFILIMAGSLLSSSSLFLLGILAFAAAVLFQVVTLPVEFNASSRAYTQLVNNGIITNEEERDSRKVLNAAAMTYVAATAIAVLELLRFILMFTGIIKNED